MGMHHGCIRTTPPVGERGLGEGGGDPTPPLPPVKEGRALFGGRGVVVKLCNAENGQQSTGEAWKSRLTNPPSSISQGSRHGSRFTTPLLVVRNVRYRRFGHASPYAIEPILSVQHDQQPGSKSLDSRPPR